MWFKNVIAEGNKFGYIVNEEKSWIILKDPKKLDEAKSLFSSTNIKLTIEGKRHLGAALGTFDFRSQYAAEKVEVWCNELRCLADFAKTQPQAAYSAFTHGTLNKYTYFMRTIPDMNEFIKPVDDVIRSELLPSLLNAIVTDADRDLYSLPIRHGGLGIPVLSEIAQSQYESSKRITLPLVTIMITQGNELPNKNEVLEIKQRIRKENDTKITERTLKVEQNQTPHTLKALHDAKMPGASSWLSVLPLEEFGFTLNKGEFRDALNLRYGRSLKGLPQTCPCGQPFNVTHALNCKRGGFVTMRHNNIRDFEADILSKIVNDVELEPELQPVSGEIFNGLSGDSARPDIRARGVWRAGQNAFFDVRVTNTQSASQVNQTTESVLRKHEQEKKRCYNKRIMNIEHGTFTPLVFAVSGGMGKECSMFHKHVAERIAVKSGERYERILSTIRCKLSFLILKSALMCVRGSRNFKLKNFEEFELVSTMAKIE